MEYTMISTFGQDFENVAVVCECIVVIVCECVVFVVCESVELLVCEIIVVIICESQIVFICESETVRIVVCRIVTLVFKSVRRIYCESAIAFIIFTIAVLIAGDVFLFLSTERVVNFPLCRVTPPIRCIYRLLYASIVSARDQKNIYKTHNKSFYRPRYKTDYFASPLIKTEAPNWSKRNCRLIFKFLAMPSCFAWLFMVKPIIVRWWIHEAMVNVPLSSIALGNGLIDLFHRASEPTFKAGAIKWAPSDGANRSKAIRVCTSSWRLVSSSKARSYVLGHGSDSGGVVKSASEKR
jgi:hypothetical protein